MSEKKISSFVVYQDMFYGTWYVLETRPDGSTARHDAESYVGAVALRDRLVAEARAAAGKEGV